MYSQIEADDYSHTIIYSIIEYYRNKQAVTKDKNI